MYRIYVVDAGETIESIANLLNIRPELLYDINGFNKNYIPRPGDQIIVPSFSNNYSTYVVKKGDTPYSIAKMYSVDVNDLLTINGLEENDYIYPDEEILIPKTERRYYITKEGDTIEEVLNQTGLSIEELLDKNTTIYIVPNQSLSL